jgi:hypothetical protein
MEININKFCCIKQADINQLQGPVNRKRLWAMIWKFSFFRASNPSVIKKTLVKCKPILKFREVSKCRVCKKLYLYI